MSEEFVDRNKELADILSLIGHYYSLQPKNGYRAKAFNVASAKIANHPIAILSGGQARKELSGIGDSIEQTIDEYLSTGHVQRLDDLEHEYQEQKDVIDYFRSFYGIGPVTAINLYNQGFRTLEDIWERGDLTEAQKIGIMWREHLKLPIPRAEMDIIKQEIGKILNPYGIIWEITGSYRRGELSSNDIDILVESRPDLNMSGVIALLRHILAADLATGDTKYMGIIRLSEKYDGHRIDIRIVPHDNWPFALMYFTGSQRFNILMRLRAIELGLKLNEYGLYDGTNHLLVAHNEADIFNLLKVQYLTPEQRTRTLDHLPYDEYAITKKAR